MNNELKYIIDNLSKLGDMAFVPGTDEVSIRNFEETNNIVFPVQFRNYLLFSDGGELFLPGGIQLYGVSHKPVIDISDDDKPSDEYYVIGALSMGDPIVCKNDSDEICIYNHEDDCIEDDERYKDFYAFLSDLPNILGI